jgi:hypothetical protein
MNDAAHGVADWNRGWTAESAVDEASEDRTELPREASCARDQAKPIFHHEMSFAVATCRIDYSICTSMSADLRDLKRNAANVRQPIIAIGPLTRRYGNSTAVQAFYGT